MSKDSPNKNLDLITEEACNSASLKEYGGS